MLQPPLPSSANPAVLGREWEPAFWGGQQQKDKQTVRVWGTEPFYPSRGWTKNNQGWSSCQPGNRSVFHASSVQFPAPSGAFEGDEGIKSSKQKAKCSGDLLNIWGKPNILACTTGNIQSCCSDTIWYEGYLANKVAVMLKIKVARGSCSRPRWLSFPRH